MQALSASGVLKTFWKAATGEVLKGNFDTDLALGKEIEIVTHTEINPSTGEPSQFPRINGTRKFILSFG